MPKLFNVGRGKLTQQEIKQKTREAEAEGAVFRFVHGNQGHCTCGWGCRIDTCKNLHYWMEEKHE